MAKRMNRGRSSESSARSRRSRGRQVRYCAVAALPGMRFRARPGTDAPYSCTRHETTEMMTISGGSSGDAGAPKQTAARMFPPTRIVPTMPVARWACPAPSASHARVSPFPSPGLMKCFARPAADRPAGTPAGVAATFPGTGHRPMEIVSPRPANPHTIVDRPRPVPAGPGLMQTSSGPDHGPARPGWNRRQAAELIPS
jgi:hypothetical protein